MAEPTTTALVLPSGEALDVAGAEPEELVTFTDRVREMREAVQDAQAVLDDEWLRRLDRRGKWTMRVGGFKVEAPSPDAGTTDYDVDELADALEELVNAGEIDLELAAEALERKVTVVFLVDCDKAIRELEELAAKDQRVVKVDVSRSPKAGAIDRVEKTGAAGKAAIARALRSKAGPARKPKVKRVGD